MTINLSETVLRELQATMTNGEIAEHLGVSKMTVWRHTKKYGCPTPNHRFIPAETWTKVEEMLDDGCSATEIARTLGISKTVIVRHYPGRGWTQEQTQDYRRVLRSLGWVEML